MERMKTVADMVSFIEGNFSNTKALNYMKDGEWKNISTESFLNQLKCVTLALQDMGIKKGDMVGILADSSPFWTISDFAIMLTGAVSVPLFGNISHENFEFEINQTGIKTIFIGGEEPIKMFLKHRDAFDTVISFDDEGTNEYIPYSSLLKRGEEIDANYPDRYSEIRSALNPEDMATIIYTSGSTGVPKGVVHTQHTLCFSFTTNPFTWDSLNDRYLTFLPPAHIFARLLNASLLTWGVSIYYFVDIKKIADACKEIHPTILIVVPRLLEKIYAKMLAKVESASPIKRMIGKWAFNLANDEEDSFLHHLMHPVADKLVYGTLREVFGGALRIVMTGGSKLNPHLHHFFVEIGMPLYEGYGMTEIGIASVNIPGSRRIGTLGPPLHGMEIKATDNGELIVRGGSVMKEYYKNPEATKRTIDDDGWLHTGDKGGIDHDGYILFESRIKEIFKSSTGEIICPIPLEMALGKIPFVDMSMVIADDRKFTSCLLFPDFEVLQSLKESEKMAHMSDEDFLETDFIKEKMKKFIDSINEHFNRWEQIRKYRFVPMPISIETGELTPSMKIKRNIVSKKYEELIDSMYADQDEIEDIYAA